TESHTCHLCSTSQCCRNPSFAISISRVPLPRIDPSLHHRHHLKLLALAISNISFKRLSSASSPAATMLPLSLLKTAQGHPMLVELKNGETYNGHLVNCDTWMNIHLREVICTSKDGDRFWRMPECYIRGNTIKYLRVPDEVIDKVQEETVKRSDRKPTIGGRGRGRGRGEEGGGRGGGRGADGGRGGRSYQDDGGAGGRGSARGGGARGGGRSGGRGGAGRGRSQ
ncbi:hypothetical protein M758_6G012500, partial [Ceratodon purpureus]